MRLIVGGRVPGPFHVSECLNRHATWARKHCLRQAGLLNLAPWGRLAGTASVTDWTSMHAQKSHKAILADPCDVDSRCFMSLARCTPKRLLVGAPSTLLMRIWSFPSWYRPAFDFLFSSPPVYICSPSCLDASAGRAREDLWVNAQHAWKLFRACFGAQKLRLLAARCWLRQPLGARQVKVVFVCVYIYIYIYIGQPHELVELMVMTARNSATLSVR